MTQPPDTTEAVIEDVYRNQHVWSAGGDSLAGAIARYAIKAHRKALDDAGWTEAPKVKIKSADVWDLIDTLSATAFVDGLQALGLPIELED